MQNINIQCFQRIPRNYLFKFSGFDFSGEIILGILILSYCVIYWMCWENKWAFIGAENDCIFLWWMLTPFEPEDMEIECKQGRSRHSVRKHLNFEMMQFHKTHGQKVKMWNRHKLATVIKGNQKASFSIATTPRCRGERYSFPWIAPLYLWNVPYIAEC